MDFLELTNMPKRHEKTALKTMCSKAVFMFICSLLFWENNQISNEPLRRMSSEAAPIITPNSPGSTVKFMSAS